MMAKARVRKATKSELAYIRDLESTSAFDLVDSGSARILSPRDYPEPLKRFLKRERNTVHINLPPRLRMQIEARSRKTGLAISSLVGRWIQAGLKRETDSNPTRTMRHHKRARPAVVTVGA